jgi:prepilin-type N-terminal cleavage/methylation domain-containing protein
MQNKNNGFSLIELSVVLVIIALISGITISIGSTQIQFAKISNAQKTLTNAKIAIATFKEKTGRLPCPADPTLASTHANYGFEVAGCDLAACPAGVICPDAVQVRGVIPFKTINLSESAAYDSWNNKLSYIVDKDLTTIATANNDGRIPVFDANGNEITASTVIGKATYILLSHGSDGKGAYKKNGTLRAACAGSESDVENCDGDAMIISRQIAATNNVVTTTDFYEDYLAHETQKLPYQKNANVNVTTLFTQISSNHSNNCGLIENGRAYCWGIDWFTSTLIPTEIPGNFTDWVQMSPGYQHTCGLRSNGKAYCWSGGTGAFVGAIDTPAGVSSKDLGAGTYNKFPTEIAGNFTDWVKISAGYYQTCAIRSNGKAYCWGSNYNGELGDGTKTDRLIPTEIAGNFTDWVQISVEYYHTCGLRSNGKAYCWGDNYVGQLGDGTTAGRLIPTEIAGNFTDWVQISVGRYRTCGIRSNGKAYCWGSPHDGELVGGGVLLVPTEIAGNFTDWLEITSGNVHTCGLRSNGKAYCWGGNLFGQLGDGTVLNRYTPTEIAGNFTDWLEITSGNSHSCGRRKNGKTYCWGSPYYGQLGTNCNLHLHETIPSCPPTKVIIPTR